jgi:hypothetical protein
VFGKSTDEPGEPLVEFEAIDAAAESDDEFAVLEIDGGRRGDRLVGNGRVARQSADGGLRQPQ